MEGEVKQEEATPEEVVEETKAEEATPAPAKEEVVADKAEKKEVEVSKAVGKIIEEIEKLKLMEVAELVSALEDKFGVSAAAPMMAMMPGAGAPAGGGEAAEEKDEFNVELVSAGESKINVIKAIREVLPELGLKDAKDIADAAPKMIKENVKKDEANAMKEKIEAAGGKVELK